MPVVVPVSVPDHGVPTPRRGQDLGGTTGAGGGRRLEIEVLIGEGGPQRADLGQQDTRVRRTVAGLLRRGPQHQVIEFGGESGGRLGGGRHLAVEVLVGHLDGGGAGERLVAGEHLVGHDAHGVDVTAFVRGGPAHQFGGDVGHRAHEGRARPGEVGGGPGQPEVRHFDPPVPGDQDVLRLHVPVDESRAVCRRQAVDHGLEIGQRDARGQGVAALQDGAQRVAGHVLHDEVGEVTVGVFVHALVQDVDDVRMGQPGGGLGLLLEALDQLGVLSQVRVEDLEGDLPVQAQVHRQVHRGHAAPGQPASDLVPSLDDGPVHGVGSVLLHHDSVDRNGPPGRDPGGVRTSSCSS